MKTKGEFIAVFKRNTESGWALIEVIAGLALLALFSIQFMYVILNTENWITQADMETKALNYAYSITQVLQADRHYFIVYGAGGYEIDTERLNNALPPPLNMPLQVETAQRSDVPGTWQIVIKVGWSEGNFVKLQSILEL
ncbi:MAG: hypothetical protein LBR98_00055 [Syntrophomonadaceae bacterium]|jgi:type II secretory pathway pseudopilin PulG|nr:hypothetical protein [Syntrophomonadaceae bacterium]